LFEKAEKKYNLAQFETALKLYSRAYELVSLPGFLFNIAQCHRNLENYKKAIFFYRQYLGKARRVGNRKTVLELIAESKKKLEAKQARLEAARRRAEQKKLEADKRREAGRKRREEEARKAAARVAHKSDPLMTEPAERDKGQSPFYERWWFWTAIGSGVVAAVATGLALGLTRNTQTVLPAGDMGTIDAR
jgi:tetratricopeptide (TPR) repeat protein